MAFSYIGMSALVAWLSDSGTDQAETAPLATTAQAALTDSEAGSDPSAEAETAADAPPPSEAQAASAAPAKVESAAKEQVALEDLPYLAGLALAGDKGVLKIVTSDAHTLYVDGEFADAGRSASCRWPQANTRSRRASTGQRRATRRTCRRGA